MADILFLMRMPRNGEDNLCLKFRGQMQGARRLGHTVHWIAWDEEGMWLMGDGEPRLLKKARHVPLYHHTMLYVDLFSALETLSRERRYDLIYMRYIITFGNAPKALRAMKQKGAKLIVEHPTYPVKNGRTTSLLRKPFFWLSDHVYRKIEPMIDQYALIGDPCGSRLNGVPAMNIVNGVDVDSLPLHKVRKEGEIGLLALASMSHWQGYDRLIESLANYDGPEHVVVHMAGGEGDGSLAAWKKLAQEKGVADRVIFHGETFGEKLNALVERCDVGVGGLGLYRINQQCSMTLKLREYMARGLPFAYAVDDPSVPKEPSFCIRLANDASAIDMNELASFALQTREDETVPQKMRTYARQRMSWEGVLKEVFEKVDIR